MIKSYRTAQVLAQELLAQAAENEPRITADLQIIASEVSAEMVGLENKFKKEESLIEKLLNKADFNSESVYKVAENMNDVLRYTFVLEFENYLESFLKTIEMLQNSDYQMPKNRIWNAWQTIGMRYDKGYRGINTTIISSKNQKFELQFHTEESFVLKTETHFLYEELRSKHFPRERQSEIIEILKKKAENVERPEGV